MVVDHAEGTRGFCAGGDIRMLAESGAADGSAAQAFFRAEYRLNTRIKNYPKPYVAFMDGVTMGGGVGISVHGSHRVATERTDVRNAGDRDRAVSGCRRRLVPAAAGAAAGHVAGADGRAAEGRRCLRGWGRDELRASRRLSGR